MALVGRIARPHGLKGDVVINPETDFVEERFRPGAVLWTRDAGGAETQLTIASSRLQGSRAVVGFAGLARIEDAERLAGQELRVPEEALQPLAAGQYYEHQLVGCVIEIAKRERDTGAKVGGETAGGEIVGTVRRVEGGLGGSRLVVDGDRGEIQIPFTEGICVEVDVAGKRIRINPPDGLLELNEVRRDEVRRSHDLSADGRGRPRGRGRQPRH
jgi:16S rRNA processing protein RimM